jgi:chemotaxis protein methyltransferase CheR
MNLEAWQDWLETRIGLELVRSSPELLRSFVARRCRELGLASEEQYRSSLDDPNGLELQQLVDALTVNHTWFFRDLEQLKSLSTLMLTEAPDRPLEIWTAGCATGEETYTVALVAASLGVDVRVLGTDLCSRAIGSARSGQFGALSLRTLPSAFADRFSSLPGHRFVIDDETRRKVTFRVHNLVTEPPAPSRGGGWDIVLCRNVLIYFTARRARETVERLAASLGPGGHLLLGASDILIDLPDALASHIIDDRIVFSKRSSKREHLLRVARGKPTHRRTKEDPVLFEPASVPEPPQMAAGHYLMELGELGAARRAYDEAFELEPTSVSALMHAGVASYFESDLQAALHRLRGCLLLDDRCWPASYYLAACYEALGLAPEARREYRHAANVCASTERTPLDDMRSPLADFRQDLTWLIKRRAAGC